MPVGDRSTPPRRSPRASRSSCRTCAARARRGGEFEPFVTEADDGVDTIAWVAAQPWCDGRVVMTGMSYVGIVQWLAAARRPPALAALTPDDHDGLRRRGLVVPRRRARVGVPAHLDRQLARRPPTSASSTTSMRRRGRRRRRDRARGRPRGSASRSTPPTGRSAHPLPVRSRPSCPALVIAGWYDCFLAGSLRSFANRDAPARPPDHRPVGTRADALPPRRRARARGGRRRRRRSACASERWPSTAPRSRARNLRARACSPTSSGAARGSSSSRGRRPDTRAVELPLTGSGCVPSRPR